MSKNINPWVLSVGELFADKRTKWDDCRFEYRYFSGNHLLQICISTPTPEDINAFYNGEMFVGLYFKDEIFFWLFKLAGLMAWSDQPISIHLLSEQDQALPTPEPGSQIELALVLVDADTGIVVALRKVSYSSHFSHRMRLALAQQKEQPFDLASHRKKIDDTYRLFPDSKALAQAAVIIERAGDIA